MGRDETRMKKILIGLTGGIASGKSTLLRHFKKYPFVKTFDSDKICHQLYNIKKIREKVIKTFGKDVISDGGINRKKLGEIIFNDFNKRKQLEKIIHPFVINEMLAEIKKFKKDKNKRIFIADVPLLFEVGLKSIFDKTILAYTPVRVQVQRLLKRNGLTKEQAIKRIKSQLPWSYKLKQSDFSVNMMLSTRKISEKVKKIISLLENHLKNT